MSRKNRKLLRSLRNYSIVVLAAITATTSTADVITLQSGYELEGKLGKIAEIGENPLAASTPKGPVRVTKVLLVDNDLTRVFVSTNNAANVATAPGATKERITIRQRVATVGRRVAGVGPIIGVTPWDDWGRRTFSMNTPKGRVDIIQGITLVTPTYCKVEGLQSRNSYVWDMRVATSAIPRATLSKILMKQLTPDNPGDRLKIVRLYLQAERYEDAQAELKGVIKDFPKLAALQKQVTELRQFSARRLIKEIRLRRDAGQHDLAIRMLRGFPQEGVAGATLLEVSEMFDVYKKRYATAQKILKLFGEQLEELDDAKKAKLEPIHKEISAKLNFNTLDRMAGYLRLAEGDTLTSEQKLSLAISGWLLGSDSGTENFGVAQDLIEVRTLVRDYLRANRPHDRDQILEKLQGLEGSHPTFLAKILANMVPPIETQATDGAIPGMFELSVPGLTGEPDFKYFIQLPPEYDPQRRYPCIVTLNGAGTTPKKQIDWWAGSFNADRKMRLGQATRRGYIVVAPVWASENQKKYKYSSREHAAVMYTLRDACRRASIDTDRVFLSGHSMGGDAAWDIGLAHPDLWAGVMPIVATADKYISRYYENARDHLPFYFVGGEKDGDRMERNKTDLNRYLRYAGYDVIITQYQGRGHEHFHDEIQNLFEWMTLQQRDFFPKKFKCVSMRPWDNFFWWAEVSNLPDASIVLPLEWPRKGAKEATIEGEVLLNNTLRLVTGADKATIWLSPEMVDFEKRITLRGGRRTRSEQVQPSAQVLLDDVRTRGDRQHPFWAKVELK